MNMHNEVIIICPSLDCGQRLKIPVHNVSLRVTCPSCSTAFIYQPTIHKDGFNLNGILSEFEKALEDEISAIKTRGGDKLIALKDGKLVGEIAGEGVYQFNLERGIPVADETPAQIEIGGKNYKASIIRFLDFKLEIRIISFNGEYISSALLKIDATYVIKKLKDAISVLKCGARNLDLALKVFNFIPPICLQCDPHFSLIDNNGNGPEPYQDSAIKVCLGNEVSFIHGPPGTGKTRTLANIVNEFANRSQYCPVITQTIAVGCDIRHLYLAGDLL